MTSKRYTSGYNTTIYVRSKLHSKEMVIVICLNLVTEPYSVFNFHQRVLRKIITKKYVILSGSIKSELYKYAWC